MAEASETSQPSRIRMTIVMGLILAPLLITAIVKYLPVLTDTTRISSVSIVPPRVQAPAEYAYLQDEVPQRLMQELSGLRTTITFQRSPTPAEIAQAGPDMAKLASIVGADTLILTSITMDAGIVQLSVQVFQPDQQRILYSKPFQSSRERYPEMLRAAGAALRRELE